MRLRTIATNIALVGLFVAISSFATIGLPNEAWAKHKKTTTTASNADPCAEPTAFIQDHIAKIRALRASLATHTNGVVGLFGTHTDADQQTNTKISDLRHDADGVNDLLRATGCKAIDIDNALKTPAPASTVTAQATNKRKHH